MDKYALFSKYSFIMSWSIPILLYYMFDPNPKFPATLSFIVRKSWVKVLHNIFFLSGWMFLMHYSQHTFDFEQNLSLFFILINGIGSMIFVVGHSEQYDLMHNITALNYMLGHFYTNKIFMASKIIKYIFRISLSNFLLSIVFANYFERTYHLLLYQMISEFVLLAVPALAINPIR